MPAVAHRFQHREDTDVHAMLLGLGVIECSLSFPLPTSPTTQAGAPLLVRHRRGQPAFAEPPLVWIVTGETGKISLTSPAGSTLGAFAHTDAVRLEAGWTKTAYGRHIVLAAMSIQPRHILGTFVPSIEN
ncbi:hypothetical protein B0H13DRAFT_2340228 [Mycena leptocephala]|nr:hypothetical protein B0H13DRAFT_2340228 [Mycena leptocephala]